MLNIKHAFIFSAILFSVTACQATQSYTPVVVTNIVDIEKSQSEIYNKARQWFSEYFVSGESVIDYEDSATGTIIGNGVADIGTDPFGFIKYKIHFSIRVDTKDGKFKTEYKINKHTNSDSTNGTYNVLSVSEGRNNLAKQEVEKITANLESYLKQGASNW